MANVYLDESNIDDLGRMVGALLSELWIMRDRMLVMEELLSRHGILDSATIDTFDWAPEQTGRVESLRDQMVASVLGAPLASRERHVDQMLSRAGYVRPV